MKGPAVAQREGVEGVAANIGFRMQVIGLDEIRRLNPFVTTEGVLAGAWTLDDGHVEAEALGNLENQFPGLANVE
mgnify:CR=1 FL=1